MSEFQVDWGKTIARLPLWRALAPDTRHALIASNASETRPAALFGPDLERLASEHWIDLSVEGTRARPAHEIAPFIRLLRALSRAPILSDPDNCPLDGYLRTHFTTDERMSLAGLDPYARHGGSWVTTAAISSASALQEFQALHDATKYEAQRLEGRYSTGIPRRTRLLKDPVTLRGAQALLKLVMAETSPIPLDALLARWVRREGCTLGGGLEPLLSYGLVLLDLDADLIPEIGLLPAIRDRIHRPAARAASVRAPQSTLTGLLALEDLETLLLELVSEPARMKQDGLELFARAAARLGAALRPPPTWLGLSPVLSGANLAERLFRSLVYANLLGLTSVEHRDEDIPYLVATDAGKSFLRKPREFRAERVLEVFRLDRIPTPDPDELKKRLRHVGRDSFEPDEAPLDRKGSGYLDPYVYEFFPTHGFEISRLARALVDLKARTSVCPVRDALVEALASLEGERFIDWEEWLEGHTRDQNPFLGAPELARESGSFMPLAGVYFSEEQLEEYWGRLLLLVASQVFVPLGGIEVGIDAEGRIALRVTDLGSWLLGRAEKLPIESAEPGEASILVQPNFDVVFLSPSPGEEAAIATFAERRGRGVGTLFAITRASCLAAASAGMRAEDAVGVLERVSKKGLPKNVVSEVKAWFKQARVVEMRRADIIICPDEETATKVLAIGGTKVRRLSELVIEVLRGKPQLVRALREKGVFVGSRLEAPPSASTPARITSRR